MPEHGFKTWSRLSVLFIRHLIQTPGSATADCRDAAAIVEQPAFVLWLESNIGETGEIQHGPESITLVGEIVTNGNGACGWIESAENHVETLGENIRLVRKQRGLLRAPVSIFFVPMAHYCTYLQRSGLSP